MGAYSGEIAYAGTDYDYPLLTDAELTALAQDDSNLCHGECGVPTPRHITGLQHFHQGLKLVRTTPNSKENKKEELTAGPSESNTIACYEFSVTHSHTVSVDLGISRSEVEAKVGVSHGQSITQSYSYNLPVYTDRESVLYSQERYDYFYYQDVISYLIYSNPITGEQTWKNETSYATAKKYLGMHFYHETR